MRLAFLLLFAALLALPARAEVIRRLPTGDRVVALTFDGCEAPSAPAWFDRRILDILVGQKIPFTVFVTGRFAARNKDELARLARMSFVEVENHSQDHPNHMERMAPDQVREQVAAADAVIEGVTGRRPTFFRFPAGNYSPAALAAVEAGGHRVVHWSWESGDPARGMTAAELKGRVHAKTRPGDILIFHINGRAPATGEALPEMLADLKRQGYRFVRLDEVLR